MTDDGDISSCFFPPKFLGSTFMQQIVERFVGQRLIPEDDSILLILTHQAYTSPPQINWLQAKSHSRLHISTEMCVQICIHTWSAFVYLTSSFISMSSKPDTLLGLMCTITTQLVKQHRQRQNASLFFFSFPNQIITWILCLHSYQLDVALGTAVCLLPDWLCPNPHPLTPMFMIC